VNYVTNLRFDIRVDDSLGKLLAVVEAPGYHEAAQQAAKQVFNLPLATRETGWIGRSGRWAARASLDDPPTKIFYVGLSQPQRSPDA
jgi:hypothetical protein